jgi:hypothetical protein
VIGAFGANIFSTKGVTPKLFICIDLQKKQTHPDIPTGSHLMSTGVNFAQVSDRVLTSFSSCGESSVTPSGHSEALITRLSNEGFNATIADAM